MVWLTSLLLIAGMEGLAAGQLPLFFIPNHGQTQADVRYLVETPDVRAGFATDGVVFQVHGQQLRVRFRGSNSETVLEGGDPLVGRASFFTGNNPSAWKTGLPTFGRLLY